jgi:hypothetical protein
LHVAALAATSYQAAIAIITALRIAYPLKYADIGNAQMWVHLVVGLLALTSLFLFFSSSITSDGSLAGNVGPFCSFRYPAVDISNTMLWWAISFHTGCLFVGVLGSLISYMIVVQQVHQSLTQLGGAEFPAAANSAAGAPAKERNPVPVIKPDKARTIRVDKSNRNREYLVSVRTRCMMLSLSFLLWGLPLTFWIENARVHVVGNNGLVIAQTLVLCLQGVHTWLFMTTPSKRLYFWSYVCFCWPRVDLEQENEESGITRRASRDSTLTSDAIPSYSHLPSPTSAHDPLPSLPAPRRESPHRAHRSSSSKFIDE